MGNLSASFKESQKTPLINRTSTFHSIEEWCNSRCREGIPRGWFQPKDYNQSWSYLRHIGFASTSSRKIVFKKWVFGIQKIDNVFSNSVLSLKVREYEVLLYLRCASKNTFWYIFGFYSFYNIACYVWCSILNRPTSYNTPRSSKTNLDLQERFSCATRVQGGERLKVQEQVGRRPKRGGAAFASVDIWALWGLELGAWPQTFSFWWGPDHIYIKTIGFGSSNTSISWNATFLVTLLSGIWKDQLLSSMELHNRDINGTELSPILAKRDSFVHHLKAKAHNKISIIMLNGSFP